MRALSLSLLIVLSACTSREPTPPPPAPRPVSKMVEQSAAAPVVAPQKKVEEQAQAPEPPYDIDADRQRRIKTAQEELGGKLQTAIVSDFWVVIGPKNWQGKAFEDSVALMKSAMTGFMNNRFGKKPEQAISVYLFGDAQSYEGFCKKKFAAPCIAHFGFYSPGERYMVMNAALGLGTLTHEMVHPLVEADFPHAPTWINEGIASVFEQPQIPRVGEIHGGKNWRWPRVRRALLSPAESADARLDHYFGMSDAIFRGDKEDLNYAAARYVCQWLDERGKLWPFFQKWRDDYASDPNGEKSFAAVTGMTPTEAHSQWAKWVLAL